MNSRAKHRNNLSYEVVCYRQNGNTATTISCATFEEAREQHRLAKQAHSQASLYQINSKEGTRRFIC